MNEQTKPIMKGVVTQVIGPVVDLRFDVGELPPLYGAVILTNPAIDERKDNLVLEVAQAKAPTSRWPIQEWRLGTTLARVEPLPFG